MASSHGFAPVVIGPSGKHSASVIFLHGLGDTGHGWAEAFQEIAAPNVRYIFPTAPVAPVTLNGGMKMHSWFDITGLAANASQDEAGIRAAANTLEELVGEEEKAGIPANRIIVGGFSQGGAVSLFYTLTRNKPIAGILGLSCWLPLHNAFPAQFGGSTVTRVLQCHGTSDPLVPLMWAELSHRMIKGLLPNSVFNKYPGMMHSACDAEMKDVKAFVSELLPHQ